MEWVVWGSIFLAFVGIALVFNTFVRLSNQVRTAWSDVDVQLARRHDLVPSLVKVVSGFANHEKQLLNDVVRLRGEALNLDSPSKLAVLEDGIQQNVNRILLLQESYPELKSSTNFLKLQHQLVEVEDEIQYARRFYNGAVREYNDAVEMFPYRLLARPFGFHVADYFKAESTAKNAVNVSL
ncbi:MAG: LemA family protein [Oceanospirillales bacterium]|nr:MAG: LemA family protein [Oceanospirillales bacterium]